MTAISAITAFSAHSADHFGSIKVYHDGRLVSKASGGKTYLVTGSNTKSRTRINFRDVTRDGWGTRAEVNQQAYYRAKTSSGTTVTRWWKLSQDKTNWYGVADGWRTSYLTESTWRSRRYRAKPKMVHHTPWYKPDHTKKGSWQYP
ncbi:MAG: hypothetical protein L0H93_21225 [Nocardioides sp.]|nr:hypothetical protein [Nocardioides sp.]